MVALPTKTIIALAVSCIFLLLLTGGVLYMYLSPSGWKAQQNAPLTQVAVGIDGKEQYIGLDNSSIDLKSFDGEVLIINMWASWSPFTQADHAILADVKKKYGDAITIRALNRKEPKETVTAYLNHITPYDGIEYIIDTHDVLYTSLGGYAMPETIFFDKVGNIIYRKHGTLDSTELQNELDNVLRD